MFVIENVLLGCRNGCGLCALALYVGYHCASIDFLGQSRSLESDRAVFRSRDGTSA